MNEKRRIRVLIVDDHAVVRSGLRTILETEPDIEIVGEAGDGHAALELAQELLPDVVLMDINMGDWDGVTATRRVRNYVPSARVIVLTNYDDDDLVFSSIRAGASGYLLKEVTATQLTNSIRTVADGFSLIYPSVARRVLDEFGQLRTNAPSGETDVYSDLTPRELETLSLLAQGKPYGRIADELNVSYKTVVNTCSQLKQKLGARNLPELIRVAVQLLAAVSA